MKPVVQSHTIFKNHFKNTLIAVFIIIFSFGCANPSYFTVRPDIGSRAWLTIAIVPFRGDIRFQDVATDTFALHMLKQNKFTVIEPETVRIKASSIFANVQQNSISILEAQKIGEQLNSDAVIIGTVTSYNNGMTLCGWATVKLVDTHTGEVLAYSHKPSGLLFGYSEHQAVVAATERAAEDMLSVLEQIQKRKDIVPTDQISNIDKKPYSPSKSDEKKPTKM